MKIEDLTQGVYMLEQQAGEIPTPLVVYKLSDTSDFIGEFVNGNTQVISEDPSREDTLNPSLLEKVDVGGLRDKYQTAARNLSRCEEILRERTQ